jgi:hypothetical protein
MLSRSLRTIFKQTNSISKFSTTPRLRAQHLEATDESYLKDYHHVNGIPTQQEGRSVTIMSLNGDKSPTQQVQLPSYGEGYFLRFYVKQGTVFREPLMDQATTLDVVPDCLNDFLPTFKSLDEAITYCKLNKWDYTVEKEVREKKPKVKDYAKQFKFKAPKEEW